MLTPAFIRWINYNILLVFSQYERIILRHIDEYICSISACTLVIPYAIRHVDFLFFENFLPSNPEKRPLFSLYFIEGLFSKDTHKNACSHSLLSRGKIFLQNRLTNAFALSIQVRGQIKNSKNQKISAVYLTKTPFPVGISGGLFQKKFADYLIFILSLSIQARASFAS